MKSRLFGIEVVAHPLLTPPPKLKLGPCAVSTEFREAFDAWLLERFGRKPESMYVIGNTRYISPEMMAKLINIGL